MSTEIDITDQNLPDEKVADLFLSAVPKAVRVAIGKPLREIIVQAIKRERIRCGEVLADGVRFHQAKKAQIEGGLQAAEATRNEQAIVDLGMQRLQIIGAMEALAGAERLIEIEPGACDTCSGVGVVPSSIRMASGQAMAMQCPGCGGTGRKTEPAAAKPAPPANGVTP